MCFFRRLQLHKIFENSREIWSEPSFHQVALSLDSNHPWTTEQDDRDAENRLVMMLDFDKFDLIKLLLRNRLKVVWCTKLARAQDESEKAKIRAEMESDPQLASVLAALQSTRTTARERQAQVQQKIKAEARKLRQGEGGAGGAAGGAAVGRSNVDLDALVFQQGGHFMSNKSCTLPEGSYRYAQRSARVTSHFLFSLFRP